MFEKELIMNASKKSLMIVLAMASVGVILWTNGCKKRETASSRAGAAMAADF